jgi:outer membrane protein TolC
MVSLRFGKCFGALGILFLLPTLPLSAQQKNYSLSSLIDSAKHYFPLLKQKSRLADAAKAEITDTRHSFLPTVSLSEELNFGSNNSIPGSYFPLGITPSTASGLAANNNYQPATGNIAVAYGEYELVNFGLNTAKLGYANANANIAEADFQRQQYLLEVDVARLYLNIQKSFYRLSADEQNIIRYQNIFNVIQALTLSGIIAGADSSLAKAELSRTKISYNQTLGIINNQKQQLAFLTGIPANRLLFDTSSNSLFSTNPTIIPLVPDTIGNPLIDFYIKRNTIYSANDMLIKKSYLPKILLEGSTWGRGSSIGYNNEYNALSDGFGYQRFNYLVGVAVTYSLFDELHKKDKLSINRFEMQATEEELQQEKLSLQSASMQADIALQTTVANLTEIPIQLQSAEATYRQKLAQYKAGLISLIDLTNASFVLYRSQTDYIETLSDSYLAQLDKAAANGSLNQFITTIK